MDETELERDRDQANPAANPAGARPMDSSSKLTNNNSFQKLPIHQLQENYGVNWIVIDNDIVHDATNSYFQQIRQPNGDIHLKLVDIFANT